MLGAVSARFQVWRFRGLDVAWMFVAFTVRLANLGCLRVSICFVLKA